jgi:hypothetical protein
MMRAVTKIRRTPDDKTIVFAKKIGGEERAKNLPCFYNEFLSAVHSYTRGVPLQKAFHFLSSSDREFLISGLTAEEYDALDEAND